jgi:hypothetical protein
LPEAINKALAQAKASGEFNGAEGPAGKDYVLTKEDKQEIADLAAELIDESGIEDEDAIKIVTELNLVAPVAADDGAIYTDENGALYSL